MKVIRSSYKTTQCAAVAEMRHSLFNCAKLSPDGSDLYGPGVRLKRARLQLVLSTAIAGLDLVALAQKPTLTATMVLDKMDSSKQGRNKYP